MSLIGYFVIIYLSLVSFLAQHLSVFVTGIVATVVSLLVYDLIMSKRGKPKVTIKPKQVNGKLGFSVDIKKKNVARGGVFINRKKYVWSNEDGTPWLNEDGKPFERKYLDVKIPSFIFLFQINGEFVDDLSVKKDGLPKKEGLFISVKEIGTQETVFSDGYSIPKEEEHIAGFFDLDDNQQSVNLKMVLIGDGLEEEKDYIAVLRLKRLDIVTSTFLELSELLEPHPHPTYPEDYNVNSGKLLKREIPVHFIGEKGTLLTVVCVFELKPKKWFAHRDIVEFIQAVHYFNSANNRIR